MPKISVIMPAYNSSKTVEKCLNSILNQSFSDFELIIINDGSTDDTYEKCSYYAKLDPRIIVINQNNAGQSIARNRGIQTASGDYLYFCDSDDYLENTILFDLYNACINNNAEISFCNFYKVDGEKKQNVDTFLENDTCISHDNAMLYISQDIIIENFLWNKLFLASLWKNIEFPKNRLFEDYSIMHSVFSRAKKIAYVKKYLYNYIKYDNSSIHSQKIDKEINDSMLAIINRIDFYTSFYPKYVDFVKCNYYKRLVYLYKKAFYNNVFKDYKFILEDYLHKYKLDFSRLLKNDKSLLFLKFKHITFNTYKIKCFIRRKLKKF